MTTGVLDEERKRMARRERERDQGDFGKKRERDQGDFDATETDELI
jgi:hypothetical protein